MLDYQRVLTYVYMSSRQNPLHLSSCSGYRFWVGPYRFPGFCEKAIPQQARKWIEQLFCWFQVLRQHFMFLSCCIYLDAFSFMFLSFACISLLLCIHFLSLSFHVSFIGIHVPFIFLSCSFHVHSNVHSCPFIVLSKVMEMAP